MDKQIRVGVYARISDGRDGQQTATGRQMDDCRAFAERKGWEVVRADEEALEALAKDFYAERLLSREEFMAARGALNQRLEMNRLKLAKRTSSGAVGRFLGHGELLRASWMQASLEWRRSIVGALLEQVEISPGRAGRLPFDPVRARPVWKY